MDANNNPIINLDPESKTALQQVIQEARPHVRSHDL